MSVRRRSIPAKSLIVNKLSMSKLALKISALALATLSPVISLAADTPTVFNPLPSADPRVIIGSIISAILSIIGSVTLIMFFYGGILWVTAMGDDKKVQKGRHILVWTTLGLIIVAGSYVLTNAVIQGLTTGSIT